GHAGHELVMTVYDPYTRSGEDTCQHQVAPHTQWTQCRRLEGWRHQDTQAQQQAQEQGPVDQDGQGGKRPRLQDEQANGYRQDGLEIEFFKHQSVQADSVPLLEFGRNIVALLLKVLDCTRVQRGIGKLQRQLNKIKVSSLRHGVCLRIAMLHHRFDDVVCRLLVHVGGGCHAKTHAPRGKCRVTVGRPSWYLLNVELRDIGFNLLGLFCSKAERTQSYERTNVNL